MFKNDFFKIVSLELLLNQVPHFKRIFNQYSKRLTYFLLWHRCQKSSIDRQPLKPLQLVTLFHELLPILENHSSCLSFNLSDPFIQNISQRRLQTLGLVKVLYQQVNFFSRFSSTQSQRLRNSSHSIVIQFLIVLLAHAKYCLFVV